MCGIFSFLGKHKILHFSIRWKCERNTKNCEILRLGKRKKYILVRNTELKFDDSYWLLFIRWFMLDHSQYCAKLCFSLIKRAYENAMMTMPFQLRFDIFFKIERYWKSKTFFFVPVFSSWQQWPNNITWIQN